ncbi:MAG: aminodeoxychorismate/anthranilate synthase component II [Methanomassiliicoccaceae archaeon]|nr:aminodeoxychorismate/anthranilate synthase component II [Methanomassiliicoccaceae archaeon]
MILLIDNYDSFSYNLYHMIAAYRDVRVIRNDAVTVSDIERIAPSAIVISPGPGRPADAGVCVETVERFHKEIPIIGICLGHQAVYEAFGGSLRYAKELMHGRSSAVSVDRENALFEGLPDVIRGARYHSLAADETALPEELKITARAADGEIMAVSHKKYPVYGVQFHPESILTPYGSMIIQNFLRVCE